MSFTPYTQLHLLKDGHVESVNALAFSKCGRYLASGGDDSKLLIWNALDGTLLQRILLKRPALCIMWHPREDNTLFFGCQDGTVIVLEDFSPDIENVGTDVLTGVDAAVYAMDVHINFGWLALAIGSEVQIAKKIPQGAFATFIILPQPPRLPHSGDNVGADDRIRGRSLHFLSDGSQLIVSYLNHGIVCWDLTTRQRLWRIIPDHRHRHIGSSALSPDSRTLLTYNLRDGMDLYQVGHDIAQRSYRYTPQRDSNYPMPVCFLNDGKMVTCGSASGHVHLWNTFTGVKRQTLEHNGIAIPHLYCPYYFLIEIAGHMVRSMSSYQSDKYALLATATANTPENTYIKIWKSPIDHVDQTTGLWDSQFDTRDWKAQLQHAWTLFVTSLIFLISCTVLYLIGEVSAPAFLEAGRWLLFLGRFLVTRCWLLGSTVLTYLSTMFLLLCNLVFGSARHYLVKLLAEPPNTTYYTAVTELLTEPTGQ